MDEKKKNTLITVLILIIFALVCAIFVIIGLMKKPEKETKVDVMEYVKTIDIEPQSRADLKAKLEGQKYTKEEIEEALSKVDYDWNQKANDYLQELVDEGLMSKQGIINYMKEEGFTDDEIDSAFKALNVEIDNNKNALSLAKNCYGQSKASITEELKKAGYSDSEIEYALKNAKFDYVSVALDIIKEEEYEYYSKAKLTEVLKEEKFTDSEIESAIKKLNANFYDRAVDLAKYVHLTVKKNEIKDYLLKQGFTEKEATVNLEWIYQVNYGIYYRSSQNSYKFAVGDDIVIGGEEFNVIDSNENETKLLAAKDIYVSDEYKDDAKYCTQTLSPTEAGYKNPGEVVFADKSYWTDSKGNLLSDFGKDYPAYVYNSKSNAYKYVEKYVSLLKNLELFTQIDGKLISYEELMKVGCKKDESTLTITCPHFVSDKGEGNSNYLTGSANNETGIYYVWNTELRDHYSLCSTCTNTNSGKIRPVITVKTSELNNFYKEYKIKGTYR